MMLQRLTPLMRAHMALAAGGGTMAAPAARLVAWPAGQRPRDLVLPPWRRLVARCAAGGPRAEDEGPYGLARLVAAPDGVRILADPPAPTLAGQVKATCRALGCSRAELIGPLKSRRLTVARTELYWLGVVWYGLSTPQIGRVLGDRDHTTVLYGRRRALAAFHAAGLADTEAALALTAEARRAIIAAHFAGTVGQGRADQRSVPA